MKNFKIYANENSRSVEIAGRLGSLLKQAGLVEMEHDGGMHADYVIAVGGDGRFLQTVRECGFCADSKFVGVNTGKLGFFQSINPDGIEDFVSAVALGQYRVQHFSYLTCKISFEDKEEKICCLNEVVIRNADLKIVNLKINIGDSPFENFTGDGIIVSTSVGSTAHSLSLGGSIVPPELHSMQLTPIAPLNSVVYRNLASSVVFPSSTVINIDTLGKELVISADGVSHSYNKVRCIEIALGENMIKCISMGQQNFWEKINRKILRGG